MQGGALAIVNILILSTRDCNRMGHLSTKVGVICRFVWVISQAGNNNFVRCMFKNNRGETNCQ